MRIIAGKWKGRQIVSPKGSETRPTSDKTRQSIFNILEHGLGFCFLDTIILDCFGGTGALGFEALSRGSQKLFYLDSSKQAHMTAEQNAKTLGATQNVRFLLKDALHPPQAQQKVDLAFFDPPYENELGEKSIHAFLEAQWFHTETILILEESKKSQIMLIEPFEIIDKRDFRDTSVYFIRQTFF